MRSAGSWLGRCAAWNTEPTNPYLTKEEIYQLALLKRGSRAFDFIEACRDEYDGTDGKSGVAYDCLSFQLLPSTFCSNSIYQNGIFLQNFWVEHKHRKEGFGKDFIRVLGLIAEETFCPILAFSNPFDFPKGFTAEEAQEDLNGNEYGTKLKYVEKGYRAIQKNTNHMFANAGFQNIDYTHLVVNKKRVTKKDIWIYIPKEYSSDLDDGEFGIAKRIIK